MITVSTIANASDTQLLCITYELFIEHIEKALTCNGKERQESVAFAREVLVTLTENLDLEVQLAKDLFRIYVYVQNLLINHHQQDEKLEEAKKLIETIYIGYKQIASSEDQVPSMENAQSVYAGMTYGRGYLNEVVMDEGNRGFMA